jgi:uncharacterized protein (DUF488 family)
VAAARPAGPRVSDGAPSRNPASAVIFTVGHSTHALDAFLALLRGAGVEAVADVRRHPGSRRSPWFAREALAESLARHGIEYVHLERLGGRRAVVPGSPNGGWENAAFRAYADHMATPAFAAGVAELEALALARPTAVMCAEAPWWRCHRRLLADALVVRGWAVCHVGSDGGLTDHALTDFAVVERGTLTYPPPQTELLGR